MSCCIFCTKELGEGQPATQLREKGCETINTLASSLGLSFIVTFGQRDHKECRRDFCRQREARQLGNSGTGFSEEYRRLRSDGGFSFGQHCLFCGKTAKLNGCKRVHDVYPMRTFDFRATLMEVCESRKDEWGNQVLARLNLHKICMHQMQSITRHVMSILELHGNYLLVNILPRKLQ
ncbi:hypothetical protein DPMN_039673 [Dreissena polymorpha]|uniref:Uncharacterized protein n=1 Tax=Dreissena polymorpha TaxID=45954 RepID=A0A9D4CWN3_DREPO|nr:hypothetical protein DPMN_039673 [Dreissena polymorpha]